MLRKKHLLRAAAILGLACLLGGLFYTPRLTHRFSRSQPQPTFRTSGTEFQRLSDGKWVPFQIQGVNIGSAAPGLFPNQNGISRDAYYRWFSMIGEMHANTIRVYNLQSPDFYSALAEYNQSHRDPIYLIQTVDFPEHFMFSQENILDPEVSRPLFEAARNTVDALHGRQFFVSHQHNRLDLYTADVSEYVLGYLMGVEWDEVFVDFVNRMNTDFTAYRGTYLNAGYDASPFESFLAQWGDELLRYEMEAYGQQKLITFCNWSDTDPFFNEIAFSSGDDGPLTAYTEVTVDAEHIVASPALKTGVFASYNVYPYYPLFLQYGEYTRYVDESGRPNPYRGYLKHLTEHHKYPVLISEFGIPSSRDLAHDDVWRGFTHGGLNEAQQAQALSAMLHDIRDAGCAGALAFSWQDEWYKRVWNEKQISDPDGRAFWCNAESTEQFYGLLSFDPGDGSVFPDGSLKEWRSEHKLLKQNGATLSMQYDEKYVYFLIDGYVPGQELSVAIDTLPDAGVTQQGNHSFGRGVDFILRIDPQQNAELLVHDSYSLLLYSMAGRTTSAITNELLARLKSLYPEAAFGGDPSSQFHTVCRASDGMYSFMNHMMDLEPVGRLSQGNANPASPQYDSNADYCIAGDSVEVRIPWQLLNFRDPSRSIIVDQLTPEDRMLSGRTIDQLYASVFTADQKEVREFGSLDLPGWQTPKWTERLKPAYYVLQEEFKGAN